MTQPCSLVRIEVTVSRVSGRRSSAHGRSGGCVAVSLSHCGQLTSFQPNVRRYGAFLRDPGQVPLPIAWRKGLGSAQRAQTAHGSAPSRHFPAPLRRSAESRPRADQCARDGRDHPSPLDARRSGAERCTVVLVALCLCAVARVHVAVATSTHLAVETITNVYTRSQYVIYWLSQLELPPLEIIPGRAFKPFHE